ncbi:hypothetical protein [Arthrobacter burdickii]|uniref:Uncharacterized protein n=1 Tax=Arthrobacter burdickii TaxID=3035920 RepID=A0ABT8K728_9MICC|nr:hypothetical protein [Arthrobacter burdickii]MDN4612317.1 hypothetical protein [Arthrobacter burdickii]
MNDSLFDFGSADTDNPEPAPLATPIRDEQVDAIREAFAKASINDQDRRKEIVESAALREVTSLRELQAHEARRVLQRISESAATTSRSAGGSDWDLREEDTWIDKL